MKYQSVINLSTKNNSHTLAHEAITSFFGNRHGRILEVGCSSGYFGASLKELGHVVWGIEPFETAARAASEVLDRVFIGVIETFFKEFPTEQFDVIVFGDVLEHIADSESVLLVCKRYLSPGGRVVASIPNVAHLSIRTMLLEGRWSYGDLGILDRTHLRFFTRDSAIDMFTQTGYEVHQIATVRLEAEQVNQMCSLGLDKEMLAATSKLIKDDRAFDFQYIFSAEPINNDAKVRKNNEFVKLQLGVRVVCLLPNIDLSLADIRIRQPLQRWALRYGGHMRLKYLSDMQSEDLDWGDVFVLQRETSPMVLRLVDCLQSHGRKVVFDIDDLLCNLPPFLGHHAAVFEQNRASFNKVMVQADAVTVTTQRLGSALKAMGAKTVVVENCTETHVLEPATHHDVLSNEVSLIVASSDRVLVDFIVPALKDVQKRLRVKIVAVGPPSEVLSAAGLDVESHPMMNYSAFKVFVASLNNCVGIIPLDDSLFSSCKSPIKFLDYALAGVPTISSAVAPYIDFVSHNVSGLLSANTTNDWIQHIESLVFSSQTRLRLSSAARQVAVSQFNMDAAARGWEGVFKTVLAKEVSIYRRALTPIPNSILGKIFNTQRHLLFMGLLKVLFRPNAYLRAYHIVVSEGFGVLLKKLILRFKAY